MRREAIRERTAQEKRWFVEGLLEACCAWESLLDKSVLVVARRVVGGLIEDCQIEASTQHVPEWLESFEITDKNPEQR
jgi:hypothetical protein